MTCVSIVPKGQMLGSAGVLPQIIDASDLTLCANHDTDIIPGAEASTSGLMLPDDIHCASSQTSNSLWPTIGTANHDACFDRGFSLVANKPPESSRSRKTIQTSSHNAIAYTSIKE